MGLSKLSDQPVDRALIERMLEAANWAPSHGDTEPWRFAVFMGEGRQALADIFTRVDENAHKRAFAAPVWIAIGLEPAVNDEGELKMTMEEELMAVACAVQNLHLMARAQGLAGMWHSKGISVHPGVAEQLGWTPPSRIMGFFMCGWPNCDWPAGERGPWQDKVRFFD